MSILYILYRIIYSAFLCVIFQTKMCYCLLLSPYCDKEKTYCWYLSRFLSICVVIGKNYMYISVVIVTFFSTFHWRRKYLFKLHLNDFDEILRLHKILGRTLWGMFRVFCVSLKYIGYNSFNSQIYYMLRMETFTILSISAKN